MSVDKPSPGPWKVHPTDNTIVTDKHGGDVAAVYGDYANPDRWHIMEANARLIAAAPDMLEALRQMEEALRTDSRQKSVLADTVEYHLDGQAMYHAINAARAAIAKAEGRS